MHPSHGRFVSNPVKHLKDSGNLLLFWVTGFSFLAIFLEDVFLELF